MIATDFNQGAAATPPFCFEEFDNGQFSADG